MSDSSQELTSLEEETTIRSVQGAWVTQYERRVLDHGYVALCDWMGNDRTPAQTARTSYRNRKERTAEQDARLTDYLIRNKHTTPLEFVQMRWYMKMPIFVARQVVRHRTASINEISYRYVKAEREFYVPADDRMAKASGDNKQGSSAEVVEDPRRCARIMRYIGNTAFDSYEELLGDGLAPEIARSVLPLSTYTEWFWQNDLHNTFHFLNLRLHPHAQYEVRVYAEAMLEILRGEFPVLVGTWEKYR